MSNIISYKALAEDQFDDIVTLGNEVHGNGYLSKDSVEALFEKSWHRDINASIVAYHKDKLVGFRLTVAQSQWQPDQWCSPELWGVDANNVCYFKCNTVSPEMQGSGIGSEMLRLAILQAQAQGSVAGLAHIWLASPGNSAYRYFSKNGGKLIRRHPKKWRYSSIHEGYDCPVCPGYCECEGAEMLLTFPPCTTR